MTLWPFFPNWSGNYTETFAYLTEIITSENGREQRRAWRQMARRSVSYDTLARRDRFYAMRRALAKQDDDLVFPDERSHAKILTPTTAGSLAATFAPMPNWMTTGRQVIFEAPGTRQRTLRTVDGVSGTTVTFTAPSPVWPARTKVMPAMFGRMAQSITIRSETDNVARVPVSLDVTPGTEIEIVGAPVTVFNGVEVLSHRPNWAKPPQFEVSDPTLWTDNQMGVRTPYRPIDFGTEVIQSEHVVRSPADLNAVLGLFQRSRGRCGEFYVPSWMNDIPLAEDVVSGASTFVVAGHDFFDAYDGDPVRKAFCVQVSGQTLYFQIDHLEKSTSGAARTFVFTTTPAPATIARANRPMVSWMLVCRFASDELTVQWLTDTVATIVTNVQSTENLL